MKHIDYRKQLKLYQNKARAYNGYNNIEQKTFRPPTSSSSPWSNMQQQQQTNQQQPSSGMRAVFLGEPGSKTGSGGTGVFLPKGIGNPSESRKKSGKIVYTFLNKHRLRVNQVFWWLILLFGFHGCWGS